MKTNNPRMVFTSPPCLRMAYKQLANFGDNFKDGLHKPTFHEDGFHAPTEANNFRMVFASPRSMRGLTRAMKADNLKDGLHKPACLEEGLHAVGKVGRQSHGRSSQAQPP